MASKQCSLCDRKFTKLEHVKRHERSHTRERPYECPTCKKHFSRSDVLFRHCKGHAQNALNRINNKRQQQKQRQTPESSEDISTPHPSAPQDDFGLSPRSNNTPPIQQDSSLVPTLERKESQFAPQINGESSENQLSLLANPVQHPSSLQQASPDNDRIEALINAAQHVEPSTDTCWRSPSPLNVDSEHDRFLTHDQDNMPPPIDPAIDMLSSSSTGHVSSLDQWAFELVQSNNPMPNRTPADALETWLFPTENDILSSGNSHHMHIDSHHDQEAIQHVANKQISLSGSSASMASRISQERFARLEGCWPFMRQKESRLMPTLWQSLASCECTNILSDIPPGTNEILVSKRERHNTQWGLDEECRDTLQGALDNASQSTVLRSESCGDTASSSGDIGSSPGADGYSFPPTEILNIALDMYLYYFHPTLPIIHIPTFSAKNAPKSLLLTMCLIGLSILGTSGASKFVSRTFLTVLQIVSAELQTFSSSNYTPSKQIQIIASGLLALNLASMTGRKSRISQSEKLYNELISTAQQQGLFSAIEGPSPDSLLEEIMDVNLRWKAWSRIECAKRIILGLLEADCWYAAYSSASPIIRPELVQIFPPSEYNLYHTDSATVWFHLIQRGARMNKNQITSSFFPTPAHKLDTSSIRGLLTFTLLQIYEANDRLASATEQHKHLEPWRTYSEDTRSRGIVPLLVDLSSSSIDVLRTVDLNYTVLWHSSCMMLGANIRYFEMAAGRSGSGPAVRALIDLSAWSQTPSARRSVLHAGHIFKLLSDRKVSDVVNQHSVVGLFQAALVLGLYIFTLPPDSTCGMNNNCNELLDLIDWTCVGHVGLTDTPNSSTAQLGFGDGSAINFIQNGGPFTVAGVPLEGGYNAARRTLLHCADLMDGLGRWKSRMFSQILHIMSDDLTDVDGLDSDEE